MARQATFFLLLAALLPPLIAIPHPPPQLDLLSTRQTVQVRPLAALLNETNNRPLPLSAKRAIVSAAAQILADFNPHLTLYHTLYNADPIRSLRALSASLPSIPSNVAFHAEMAAIFTALHDRHTTYLKPAPLRNSFATLRVRVRLFFAPATGKRRRYAVSALTNAYKPENTTFAAGVELLAWDGVPIDKVVRRLGKAGAGSNDDARLQNALQLLTIRLLIAEPIPKAPTVSIRFRDAAGKVDTFPVPWIFAQVMDENMTRVMNRKFTPMSDTAAPTARPRPVSVRTEAEQLEIPGQESVRIPQSDRKTITVDPDFNELFSAEIITTTAGPIGRFLVPTFNANVTKALVNEISRILRLMPTTGLVMDLRGNTGGRAEYVKALVELISDKTVPEQPVVIRSSEFVQKLYNGDLKGATGNERKIIVGYRAAINTARKAGEPFTGPTTSLYSLAPPGRQQQVYKGPLVTVVDGLTYSAGDLFAALQVDQKVSPLVGVPGNVGAGGASTIPYSDLQRIFSKPLAPLPGGVDFTTSLERFFRTGPNAGAIVESFGVEPDIRYLPTFDDAVKSDCDLFEFLGEKLILRQPTKSPSPSPTVARSTPSPPLASPSPSLAASPPSTSSPATTPVTSPSASPLASNPSPSTSASTTASIPSA